MSGNARQRAAEREHKELLEIGRRAKHEIEARAADLASARAAHAHELAGLRAQYAREIESWAASARSDANLVAKLRGQLQEARERVQFLLAQQDEIKHGGLLTRREHEAALAAETAKLRNRLRRAQEERLAPKTVVLEQVARR